MPENCWDETSASSLSLLDRLIYRSNLLGADRSIVNYGGGNTSSKGRTVDHRGRDIDVMWIKGSGSDLETVNASGFPALSLEEVREVASQEAMTDEEMVTYLSHCALDPAGPRPSIETMLHAFLPFDHVDHTHPEAAIALCCSARGEELAREWFGKELVWVPYVRPGFALAKLAAEAQRRQPEAKGMLLAKHGLVTWSDSGRDSYIRTIEILSRLAILLEANVNVSASFGDPITGGARRTGQRKVLMQLLPAIRGRINRISPDEPPMVLHFDDSPEVMEFVNGCNMPNLAHTGAACPDHVMYTKFLPLIAASDLSAVATRPDAGVFVDAVLEAVDKYVLDYKNFFERFADEDAHMLRPSPRVILLPGVGMVTLGCDAWAARNTASLYRTAIRVMRWASANGGYTSLTSEEAWDIEYWPLELYKLTLKPPPKELSGRIAVVTGGAGAIGRATARRMLQEGAHVVIADIEETRLRSVADGLEQEFPDCVHGVHSDATAESDVERIFAEAVETFGGVDIVVPNAGIATAAPIDDTTIEDWDRVSSVLFRGYFLTCRSAFRVMKVQCTGGSIVMTSSKNGLAAGPDAIAYATAKAAELHMARCLAEEGGRFQIRVNAVAPDAVIQGSGLWNEEWREARARAYGFDTEELEEFYRNRNALKVSVGAEDVAEAILFLASKRAAKTTGCVITVDGGLAVAYPR